MLGRDPAIDADQDIADHLAVGLGDQGLVGAEEVPASAGLMEPIEVVAPPGTIVNPLVSDLFADETALANVMSGKFVRNANPEEISLAACAVDGGNESMALPAGSGFGSGGRFSSAAPVSARSGCMVSIVTCPSIWDPSLTTLVGDEHPRHAMARILISAR